MRSYTNKIKVVKNIMLILLLMPILTAIPFNKSQATLQSNPNTQYTTKDWGTTWIKTIRQMESTGGALGLDETINSDLTPTTNNGIDVHMIRSTEYGATAILSASGYGNPDILQNSAVKTTTGNKTGIYYDGQNWENVAGSAISRGFDRALGCSTRYYDRYTTDTSSAKPRGCFERLCKLA